MTNAHRDTPTSPADMLRQQLLQSPCETALWSAYASILDNEDPGFALTARAITSAYELLAKEIHRGKIPVHPGTMTPFAFSDEEISQLAALSDLPLSPDDLEDAAKLVASKLALPEMARLLSEEAIRLGRQPAEFSRTGPLHDAPTASDLFRKTGHLTVLPQLINTGPLKNELTLDLKQVQTWDEERLLQEFETALLGNQIKNATMLVEAHALLVPDSSKTWDLWTTLGLKCFEASSLEGARRAYEKALKLRPNFVASWFNLGVTLHYLRQLPEALKHYMGATEIDPAQPKVWCNLGAYYFELADYEASEEASRKALEYRPDYVRAWDNLAVALGSASKWPEAADACRKALEIDPDSLPALLKLGIIYFYEANYVEADQAFARTEKDVRFLALSLAYRSIGASRTGEFEAAKSYLRRLQNEQPDSDLESLGWNEMSVSLFDLKKYEDAALAAESAIARRTEFPKAWFNLGLARKQLGQIDLASKAFNAASKLDPADEEAKKLAHLTRRPMRKIIFNRENKR